MAVYKGNPYLEQYRAELKAKQEAAESAEFEKDLLNRICKGWQVLEHDATLRRKVITPEARELILRKAVGIVVHNRNRAELEAPLNRMIQKHFGGFMLMRFDKKYKSFFRKRKRSEFFDPKIPLHKFASGPKEPLLVEENVAKLPYIVIRFPELKHYVRNRHEVRFL